MPLGVTTLAQLNGNDGLGAKDGEEQTKMLVGVGSIALMMIGLVMAGGMARGLVANKRHRRYRRKHKHNGSCGCAYTSNGRRGGRKSHRKHGKRRSRRK